MMFKILKTVAAILLFSLLAGCAAKQHDPKGVTYDFWLAQKQHDMKKASRLALKSNPDDVAIHSKIKIDRIDYGEPKVEGNSARVPTTLYLKDFAPQSGQEAKVTFDTFLQKNKEGWKVDTFETKKALYLAAGKAYAQNLSTALASTLKNLLGDKQQIEGIFQKLLQGIHQTIEEAPKSN